MSYTNVIRRAVADSMQRLGYTQTSLAVALGLSQAAVSKKMRGVTPFSTRDIDALTALGFTFPAPCVEVSA